MEWKTKQLNGPGNYRELRETGPRTAEWRKNVVQDRECTMSCNIFSSFCVLSLPAVLLLKVSNHENQTTQVHLNSPASDSALGARACWCFDLVVFCSPPLSAAVGAEHCSFPDKKIYLIEASAHRRICLTVHGDGGELHSSIKAHRAIRWRDNTNSNFAIFDFIPMFDWVSKWVYFSLVQSHK